MYLFQLILIGADQASGGSLHVQHQCSVQIKEAAWKSAGSRLAPYRPPFGMSTADAIGASEELYNAQKLLLRVSNFRSPESFAYHCDRVQSVQLTRLNTCIAMLDPA